MAEWWSIEVMHGEFSGFRWQGQHDSALIEAALTNGARDGTWHADSWGVVFEVLFETEEQWQTFRACLPSARRWTPSPIRSTGCSFTAAVAAEQVPASRAGPSPPRLRGDSLPEPEESRTWI